MPYTQIQRNLWFSCLYTNNKEHYLLFSSSALKKYTAAK